MDSNEIMELSHRLDAVVTELDRMVNAVATARQVREYNSELRKNLLARYTARLLHENSATAAETLARANCDYQSDMEQLKVVYETAERHLARWDVLFAKLEASRSALSLAKEQMKL